MWKSVCREDNIENNLYRNRMWTGEVDGACSRYGSMTGICEYGSKPLGSLKADFQEQRNMEFDGYGRVFSKR